MVLEVREVALWCTPMTSTGSVVVEIDDIDGFASPRSPAKQRSKKHAQWAGHAPTRSDR